MKKTLLNEPLTEPSFSTGVVDAAIQVNLFHKLQQHNAVVTTELRTQDLNEETVLIYENILTSKSRSDCLTTNNSEIIQFNNSASLSTVTSVRASNENDIKCDYTCELEEDNNGSYSDIEVNTTK